MVTKAIIPAGGVGTRFLPTTKVLPKEMLPILEKPAIQYIVEEGLRAGLKNYIVVTSKHKTCLEDHFDMNQELVSFLEEKGKHNLIDGIEKIVQLANFVYIRQREPRGLGHAIWTARNVIGKEYVAIFLPDDIIVHSTPAIGQLMQVAQQEKCSVIAVQEVPMNAVANYGVIGVRKQFSPNLFQVKELVEKPTVSQAPSNLAIIGRYVLSPSIFGALDELKIGVNGEVQLTDAIQSLLLSGEKVFAYKVQGVRHDVGNPMGLLKANIDLALRNPKYSDILLEYLSELDREFVVMQGKANLLNKNAGNKPILPL